MARGLSGIKDANEQIQARRTSQGEFYRRFKIADRESAIVRFLEEGEDVHWCWVVTLPPKAGQRYGDFTPTLDQAGKGETPCPFLERGMKPKVRGYLNVIWRNAPKYQRDSNNRLVKDANNQYIQIGTEDALAVWEVGITVLDDLAGIDATYKGLLSRDFRITRMGTELNTRYRIDPADPDAGPQPMSAADKELAAQKTDLTPLVTPLSYEAATALLTGAPVQNNQQQEQQAQANPFLQARQAREQS